MIGQFGKGRKKREVIKAWGSFFPDLIRLELITYYSNL